MPHVSQDTLNGDFSYEEPRLVVLAEVHIRVFYALSIKDV